MEEQANTADCNAFIHQHMYVYVPSNIAATIKHDLAIRYRSATSARVCDMFTCFGANNVNSYYTYTVSKKCSGHKPSNATRSTYRR